VADLDNQVPIRGVRNLQRLILLSKHSTKTPFTLRLAVCETDSIYPPIQEKLHHFSNLTKNFTRSFNQ
jgi:hypothetical protein